MWRGAGTKAISIRVRPTVMAIRHTTRSWRRALPEGHCYATTGFELEAARQADGGIAICIVEEPTCTTARRSSGTAAAPSMSSTVRNLATGPSAQKATSVPESTSPTARSHGHKHTSSDDPATAGSERRQPLTARYLVRPSSSRRTAANSRAAALDMCSVVRCSTRAGSPDSMASSSGWCARNAMSSGCHDA